MAELKRATIHYRIPDYATVCEKALYAAWKHQPDLNKIKLDSTYDGEALRVDIAEIRWLQKGHIVRESRRAIFLRRALTWYLARLDYRPQPGTAVPEALAHSPAASTEPEEDGAVVE